MEICTIPLCPFADYLSITNDISLGEKVGPVSDKGQKVGLLLNRIEILLLS